MAEENKQKLIDDTLKSIEKQFGKGSIMKLGDKVYEHMEVVPTGSLALDLAFSFPLPLSEKIPIICSVFPLSDCFLILFDFL